MLFKQALCKVVINPRYWLNCQVILFPMRMKSYIDSSRKMIHIFRAHLPTASLLQKIQDMVSPTEICASQSHTHFLLADRYMNQNSFARSKVHCILIDPVNLYISAQLNRRILTISIIIFVFKNGQCYASFWGLIYFSLLNVSRTSYSFKSMQAF